MRRPSPDGGDHQHEWQRSIGVGGDVWFICPRCSAGVKPDGRGGYVRIATGEPYPDERQPSLGL